MDYNLQKNQNAEQTYHSIRNSIVSAQHRLSTAVNSAMVTTYWEIENRFLKHVEKMIAQNTERNYWNIFLSS